MKYHHLGALLLLSIGSSGCLSTDPASGPDAASGVVEGRLRACPPSPNCVSSEAGTSEAQRVEALPTAAWNRLPETIAAMGGDVTEQGERYVAAEFTSRLMRYVDDLELRLAGDAVHVRSASRVGYSDMGVNRDRVEALRERLGAP